MGMYSESETLQVTTPSSLYCLVERTGGNGSFWGIGERAYCGVRHLYFVFFSSLSMVYLTDANISVIRLGMVPWNAGRRLRGRGPALSVRRLWEEIQTQTIPRKPSEAGMWSSAKAAVPTMSLQNVATRKPQEAYCWKTSGRRHTCREKGVACQGKEPQLASLCSLDRHSLSPPEWGPGFRVKTLWSVRGNQRCPEIPFSSELMSEGIAGKTYYAVQSRHHFSEGLSPNGLACCLNGRREEEVWKSQDGLERLRKCLPLLYRNCDVIVYCYFQILCSYPLWFRLCTFVSASIKRPST